MARPGREGPRRRRVHRPPQCCIVCDTARPDRRAGAEEGVVCEPWRQHTGEAVTIRGNQVGAAVDALAFGYERLVLIVGPPGSGKSSALRDAAEQRRWPVANLSFELAQRMLELPVQQRPARALDTIRGLLDELDSDVACLDNIELLFEPSLQLDPLGLLQSLSRQKTLVVAWPGGIVGDEDSPRLVHAERPHPEYREYPGRGLVLLSVPAEE
jgi:hypothetical protein